MSMAQGLRVQPAMKRGFSGAVIQTCIKGVIKYGPPDKGITEQAKHCQLLFPVTPRIISMHGSHRSQSYIMEELKEPFMDAANATGWALQTLETMQNLLQLKVWSCSAKDSLHWIHPLRAFLAIFKYDLNRLMDDLFVRRGVLQYTQIHGDPTLSNVLYRETGGLVITDPIPPRGKIPHHYTVDLGKMLQSALGWETQLFGWQYDQARCILTLMHGHSQTAQARAWFWAGVHCLRIYPYASQDSSVRIWAIDRATVSFNNAARIAQNSSGAT